MTRLEMKPSPSARSPLPVVATDRASVMAAMRTALGPPISLYCITIQVLYTNQQEQSSADACGVVRAVGGPGLAHPAEDVLIDLAGPFQVQEVAGVLDHDDA